MKNNDNTTEKAIEALKQSEIPDGPSKELVNTTLGKLHQISSQSENENFNKQSSHSEKYLLIKNLLRIAAIVIVFIAIGFFAGKISEPKQYDIAQIQNELEPAIREKLFNEVTQYVQLGITTGYVQLREELTEQYRQDLYQASHEILNASGTITNQLLEQLIQAIATTQVQERQLIAAALEQIELNRLEDKTQLGSALLTFASQTEQDLLQTQENVALIAQFLTNTNTDNPIQNESENSNN